ncbi:Rossmann-like and DUF2520 domain-containing protein [Wenyingzhuangia sp. IMCC45574]
MIKVCILGAGKVGSHFIKECINNPVLNLVQIYNRTLQPIKIYQDSILITQDTTHLVKADVYLICLADDVIKTLDLSSLKGLVVHTSGTKPYQEINAKQRGVLYPLQSFSKEKHLDFKQVPLCIETEFENDLELLFKLANAISTKVQVLQASQREKLHLAAVFANNFSNRMMGIAYDLCKKQKIDFTFLQPLLQETFLKTQVLPPHIAQTGPAIREDQATINKHLEQLTGLDKEIYKLVTQSIQKRHGEKL